MAGIFQNAVIRQMAKCVELRRLSGAYGITQLPQSHSTLVRIQAISGCEIAI
jgi:hypothetical protein